MQWRKLKNIILLILLALNLALAGLIGGPALSDYYHELQAGREAVAFLEQKGIGFGNAEIPDPTQLISQNVARAREEEGRVLVSVGDQGPGVAEESLSHIFDKFYQGDTSHRAEGNGLGLALVREIAQVHGGNVSVENRDGAVFTVELAK